MNDPRLIFMDEVVKPVKRRKSTDTNKNEPLPTFSISAFKDPLKSKPSSIISASPSLPVRPSFKPKPFGGGFDLGGDLGGLGPRVPSLGPKKELTRVEKLNERVEKKKIKQKNPLLDLVQSKPPQSIKICLLWIICTKPRPRMSSTSSRDKLRRM